MLWLVMIFCLLSNHKIGAEWTVLHDGGPSKFAWKVSQRCTGNDDEADTIIPEVEVSRGCNLAFITPGTLLLPSLVYNLLVWCSTVVEGSSRVMHHPISLTTQHTPVHPETRSLVQSLQYQSLPLTIRQPYIGSATKLGIRLLMISASESEQPVGDFPRWACGEKSHVQYILGHGQRIRAADCSWAARLQSAVVASLCKHLK